MLKIDIQNINIKTSNTERILLKDIKFELEKNKIFTVLGKNGTGKSTLIKSIMKLLDTDIYSIKGKVFLNEKDIYKMEIEQLLGVRAKLVKYVFQDAVNSFDHLKKFEYYFIKFAVNKNEIDELLEYFFLPVKDKLFRMYPYEISGGMAQRVSLVLALLSKPKILILDEPTSGIDSAIANLMLLKLKEYSQINDHSVLLVTQDILFAKKISDKIALLQNSTLTEFMYNDEFFEKHGLLTEKEKV